VHLAEMPKSDDSIDWRSEEGKWAKIMNLRDEVLGKLEDLRREKKIGSNQEAAVKIRTPDNDLVSLIKDQITEKGFAALCIVSEVEIGQLGGRLYEDGVDITNEIQPIVAVGKKCQRCWNYWPSVGTNKEYPDLCKRCLETVKLLNS
jgi:isoleucyl-tRNA synthetase